MIGLPSLLFGTVGLLQGGIKISEYLEEKMKNYDIIVEPPIDKVSILMPAYNEEQFIEQAASSIRYQSILFEYPEMFEFIVIDNGSTDRTIEKALPFADKVVKSPKGKLTARNYGTRIANGNIIVATDADIFYPFGWLNTILKPFTKNENIVGTSGTVMDYHFPGIPRSLFSIGSSIGRVVDNNQMFGGNSTYLKDAFYEVTNGYGFNENINQFEVQEMLEEEERDFGRKLSALGKVDYVFNAGCIHLGGMRTSCRMGFSDRFSQECASYGFGIERFG